MQRVLAAGAPLGAGLRRFCALWLISLIALSGCSSVPKKPPPAPGPTSATAGTTTIVAIAPPPAAGPSFSLPKMLGLPELGAGICHVAQHLGSRLANALDLTGRFPALQPQPPILALTDPANLEPTAPPAVQAAAEIKAEEDAAPQKIMALRYLATIGCGGCYEKVEDALLQGMSDCTEAVRFEAVRALECKPDGCCKFCSSSSCCSLPVRKRLGELTTCEAEPSARVRRSARLALACCMGKPLEAEDVPREGPPAAPPLPTTADANDSNSAAPGSSLANTSIASAIADPATTTFFADMQLVATTSLHPAASTISNPTSQAGTPSASMPIMPPRGAVPTAAQAQSPAIAQMQPLLQPAAAARTPSENAFADSHDPVLARVNGQPITASQVRPLVDAHFRNSSVSLVSDLGSQRRDVQYRQLLRVIDWTLLEQAARQQTVGSAQAGPLSPVQVQAWFERNVFVESAVPPSEIVAFYQVHRHEFQLPARLRWERIAVLVDRCGSKAEATTVATYLKRRGEGEAIGPPNFFAQNMVEAVTQDWCELPGIASADERRILESLPEGQISHIVDDGSRLLLYRVIQREAVRMKPLSSVAADITAAIINERRTAAIERFMAQIRSGAQVWLSPDVLPTAEDVRVASFARQPAGGEHARSFSLLPPANMNMTTSP